MHNRLLDTQLKSTEDIFGSQNFYKSTHDLKMESKNDQTLLQHSRNATDCSIKRYTFVILY